MSDPICVVCEKRPTPDGYACSGCASRAGDHLDSIAELAPDARLVAAGLVRRGGGGGSNKPGSRPPLNDGATDALDEVQNMLTTLARDIAETRGLQSASATSGGRLAPDPLIAAARWLSGQLEWLRHAVDGSEPYAIRAFDEIADCAGRLRSIINGPTPGRYAGPCSYIDGDGNVCRQDVEARPGASIGRCKTCGSEYDVDEQQKWMRGEIEDYLARPIEISGMLLRLGFPVGYSTIAAYAAKGQLIAHGSDEKGRPLFRIGDVIDLRMGARKPRQERQLPRGAANPVGG